MGARREREFMVTAILVTASVLAFSPLAAANIVNGGFETGNLSGWTLFTTANGRTGPPTVVLFDTAGGGASNAAQFLVGQLSSVSGDQQGGGIYQDFSTTGGILVFSADIASENATIFPNGAGGFFSMLLDGNTVASWDFGFIAVAATERSTLSYVGPVSAGTHELRFLITRPFLAGPPPGGTPYQYLDNITATSVPEPATLVLLIASGLAGSAARYLSVLFRRRQRRHGGWELRTESNSQSFARFRQEVGWRNCSPPPISEPCRYSPATPLLTTILN